MALIKKVIYFIINMMWILFTTLG